MFQVVCWGFLIKILSTFYVLPISATYRAHVVVGIPQSVERRATGWKVRVGFSVVQDFSPLHSFKSSSGAHPTSYPMGTRDFFSVGKAAGAWNWAHLHLVSRLRMVQLYLHSPMRLNGIVINWLRPRTTLPFYPTHVIFYLSTLRTFSE
jgi:hypothetical protein